MEEEVFLSFYSVVVEVLFPGGNISNNFSRGTFSNALCRPSSGSIQAPLDGVLGRFFFADVCSLSGAEVFLVTGLPDRLGASAVISEPGGAVEASSGGEDCFAGFVGGLRAIFVFLPFQINGVR